MLVVFVDERTLKPLVKEQSELTNFKPSVKHGIKGFTNSIAANKYLNLLLSKLHTN